jgi:ferredoxin-NADP reductase
MTDGKRYVFIAGGIGITPFRSIIKDLMDKKQKTDITLFYQARDESELMFTDIFTHAQKVIGLQTIYLLQEPSVLWKGETGFVTQSLLEKYVPQYSSCQYYLSGSLTMVEAYSTLLEGLAIPSDQIKMDLFTGYK